MSTGFANSLKPPVDAVRHFATKTSTATKQASTSLPKPSGRGLLICLLAKPGLGKTSLLAQIPDVEFICDCRDQGILDLIEYAEQTKVFIPRERIHVVDSFQSLLTTVKMSSAPTLAIESLVGIQALCEDQALEIDYESSAKGFCAFRNGFDTAANKYFQELIDVLLDKQEKKQNVFVTGHAKTGTAKAVVGDDWVSQVMECRPEIARRVDASFQNILHIGSITSTSKPAGKVRAGGMSTQMYFDINPHFPGKNRMGLVGSEEYPADAESAYKMLCNLLKFSPTTFRRL